MSQIEQLEMAVKALPKDDLQDFKLWLLEYAELQIEKDSGANSSSVVQIIAKAAADSKKPRQAGTLRGTVLSMAPDFDAPLEDFNEYMA